MTNDELFEELSQLLLAREAILESADTPMFEEKCRSLLVGAIGLARELCGDTVMKAAAGTLPDDASRVDVLHLIAARTDLMSYAFASLEEDEAGLHLVHDEIRYIAGGDKPVIFARLPGPKVKIRVHFAKLMALAWNEYLDGLGISSVDRQAEISKAFGHPWDTISRWDAFPVAIEGEEWVRRHLAKYNRRGRDGLPLLEMKQDETWQAGLQRVGKEFHAINKASSGS